MMVIQSSISSAFTIRKTCSHFLLVVIFYLVAIPLSITFAASNIEEGIKELAQQISRNMTETGKKKVAVVEFSDLNGNVRALGQFIAEELITELFLISPGQFEVVERRQLMKVLDEQKLTTSGLLDAEAMDSVGKILGIEAIVTGSITDLGNDVKVNARMIGVDTAKVFAVARANIPKIGIVATMWDKIIEPHQIVQTTPQSTDKLSPSSVYSNKNSRIFHTYNCPELNTEGLVEFKSTKSAIKAGGMACRRCNPSQQVTGRGESVQGNISTSTPSFQNDFLRVTLQSISKSKKKVNIVVTMDNLLNEDLLIGLKTHGRWEPSAVLVDGRGGEWLLSKIRGVSTIWAGSGSRPELNKEEYTVFSPLSKNTIVMVFATSENEGSEGKVFSFSSNMLRLVNKTPILFTFGLRDMRITQ